MLMVLTTPPSYTPCHYTTNRPIIDDPYVNARFVDLLRMSDVEFKGWLAVVRDAIMHQWDAHNVPPRVGMTDGEIRHAWTRFADDDASSTWVTADDGALCLFAPPTSHAVVNQWFPTMMKTRINYTAEDKGISIYDMFNDPKLWERYVRSYAARHFLRDSFYAYSRAVHTHEAHPTTHRVATSTRDYMEMTRDVPSDPTSALFGGSEEIGVWLSPATGDDSYTGYSNHLKDRSIWTVSQDDALALQASGEFPAHWFRHVSRDMKKTHYMMRVYSHDTRVFPDGFKSFRISMCQPAVNWPALAARAVYERFTEGVSSPVIWDPSAGWGGRLAGAVTTKNNPLYIACDPNTDHLLPHGSKYTEIAAYHSDLRPFAERARVMFFSCGSEEMQHQPAFQHYRGQVDVVFTSPPYFNREAYSTDDAQSYKRFAAFNDWCIGFLHPTIRTAAEWLKPGGYLLWNIADIKHGKQYLPLEAKSIEYATGSGLIQQDTIRLLMASMPGANRVLDGAGTAKNTCTIKGGRVSKFEPIFVFKKP